MSDETHITELPNENITAPRTNELSAAALGRLLGIATSAELKVFESKIDLLTQKMAGMAAKIEKLTQAVNKVPSANDIERIDVHVGAIKAMLRELMGKDNEPQEG